MDKPNKIANPFERRKGGNIFGAANSRYQVCVRCVMDTSDPEIAFDDVGVCNHCHDYQNAVANHVFPPPEGERKLLSLVEQIKRDGRGKRYDCILGLSGGVDSSYVAYLCKSYGLRPLAVHMDNGWNSEPAVRNIENIVQILDFDLDTFVLDWQEFRNLQLAFLKASTPDSEIPTDHAIIATLYKTAIRHRVKWIMDGSNIVTEMMVPPIWSHGHSDWGYIKKINDLHSLTALKTYPRSTYFEQIFKFPYINRIRRLPVLNYVNYDKQDAIETLKREVGWQPYGGKHYESIYTRFYQGYILPEKFGFDKRRSHLACLVLDGGMTRDQALAELQRPALDVDQVREDRTFVVKKLGISELEFDAIMAAERKTFWDYPSDERDLPGTLKFRLIWLAAGLTGAGGQIFKAIRELPRSPRTSLQIVYNSWGPVVAPLLKSALSPARYERLRQRVKALRSPTDIS